jgi:hypothetical protein
MLDHYQQTKNLLVSYSPEEARLLLICFDLGQSTWDGVARGLLQSARNDAIANFKKLSLLLRCRPA